MSDLEFRGGPIATWKLLVDAFLVVSPVWDQIDAELAERDPQVSLEVSDEHRDERREPE